MYTTIAYRVFPLTYRRTVAQKHRPHQPVVTLPRSIVLKGLKLKPGATIDEWR